MINQPNMIVIHCSDVSHTQVRDQFAMINAYHRDVRGFPRSSLGYFVGYHTLQTGGKKYVCRADTDEGAHCNQVINGRSINFQSLGTCMGFDGDIEYPLPEDYKNTQEQVKAWQMKWSIPNNKVFFHRTFATEKTCPGLLITPSWLDSFLNPPATPVTPTIKVEELLKQQRSLMEQVIALATQLVEVLRKRLSGK